MDTYSQGVRRRWRLLAVAPLIMALVCAAPDLDGPAARAADAASLTVVGHDDLGARGLNAGLALADHCAFVGSRNGEDDGYWAENQIVSFVERSSSRQNGDEALARTAE